MDELKELYQSLKYEKCDSLSGRERLIIESLIVVMDRIDDVDRKARLECERIALQYSQAYGQIDDAMAIARDIRATIPENQP